MSAKTEKLWYIIRDLVTPIIVAHVKEFGEQFGIASVSDVKISSDYSYADISVFSSKNEKELPKFLAPLATELRALVGREVQTRKIPLIRFRVTKNQAEANRVFEIISQLESQYDLNT